MLPRKLYLLFVILFPIIYFLHNAEEWFVFDCKISFILNYIPTDFKVTGSIDTKILSLAFGLALIFATIIPLVAAFIIWHKITTLNIKVLLVMALVTLINAFSHLSSSILLGFLSPGFITGLILCLPYSIVVIHLIRKYNKYTIRQYFLFCCLSILIYVTGVALSWVIGLLVISNL